MEVVQPSSEPALPPRSTTAAAPGPAPGPDPGPTPAATPTPSTPKVGARAARRRGRGWRRAVLDVVAVLVQVGVEAARAERANVGAVAAAAAAVAAASRRLVVPVVWAEGDSKEARDNAGWGTEDRGRHWSLLTQSFVLGTSADYEKREEEKRKMDLTEAVHSTQQNAYKASGTLLYISASSKMQVQNRQPRAC